jgi:hypothetical protein
MVRRLESGVGWVAIDDPQNVRPAWTASEVAALLAGDA